MTKPNILVLDIETRPALSYHWRMFKENIGTEQVVESGGIICVGLKWVGDKNVHLFSVWEHGEREMLEATHAALTMADAVVTKNGDTFDIPHLMTAFLKHGMKMPPPLTSIDLYKTLRNKLKFLSNKLDFVAQELGVGKKVKHEGFPLWRKVMEGNEAARKRMLRYCRGDVVITERLYKKMLPFIVDHPNMQFQEKGACGACGSTHLQKRGFRRTKCFEIQRIQCQDCGGWSSGTRRKVA